MIEHVHIILCNIHIIHLHSLTNTTPRSHTTQDVILSGIVGVGYVVALIMSGYSSHEWKNFSDSSINHSFIATAVSNKKYYVL